MKIEIDEEILINYLSGKLSEEDFLLVEHWYNASPENKKILEQLYFTLFVYERIQVMENIDVEKSLLDLKQKLKQKETSSSVQKIKNKKFLYLKIASAVAALLGVIWGGFYATDHLSDIASESFTVSTGAGEHQQATLPDGSQIWLNSKSEVSYHNSLFSSERKVKMKGEVYFEVKKDNDTPFIVSNNHVQVKVLGTKFNIQSIDNQSVATTLIEGSVYVTSPSIKGEGIEMEPYQHFVINYHTGNATLTEISNPEKYIGWINGKLSFEETTLEEIANTLGQYYNMKITFSNEALKKERFTGNFDTTQDIFHILSILSLTEKFDYKTKGEQIEISVKH